MYRQESHSLSRFCVYCIVRQGTKKNRRKKTWFCGHSCHFLNSLFLLSTGYTWHNIHFNLHFSPTGKVELLFILICIQMLLPKTKLRHQTRHARLELLWCLKVDLQGDTLHDTTRVMQRVSQWKHPKTYVTWRKYVAWNMSHQLKETYLRKMAGVSCKLSQPVIPP